MRKACMVLLLTAAGLAAQASADTGTATTPATEKKAKKTTAKKVTPPPPPMIIPKGAVANADGTYAWKDKQGKNWIFVNTPFGVMKTEASTAPVTTTSSLAGVKAFDEGDKVRFERPTPFGPMKWEKNKTELTDEERTLVNNQAGGQNAKQD